ncbi:16529_t:CDS:2, partial [Funneliformis mosseae]
MVTLYVQDGYTGLYFSNEKHGTCWRSLKSEFQGLKMFNVTVECTYCDEEGDEDTTKFTALKHQVHTLRHDLAEKNALLATVQKKLNRNRPQQYNNGTMSNESTTGKVIGHLQHEIEHLKKEVADAKTSIHIAKVARERADRQAAENYASHQTLKLEIDSLKRMLE